MREKIKKKKNLRKNQKHQQHKTIMDELTQKEIEEYMSGLPQTVKNIILEDFWSKRTEEIGVKYSLSEKQLMVLQNLVLFVIIGVENPNTLGESIKNELGISELLAEQIKNDLEVRVFDYIIKTIQNQEKKGESIEKGEGDDLPEVRPEITPLVEPQEKVRVRPVPVGFTDASPKPIPKPQMPVPELVQRPISVPRYTAVPMEEERNSSQEIVVSSKETPKPNEVTSSQPASAPQTSTTPQPVPEPVKKYAVDPYREPLE